MSTLVALWVAIAVEAVAIAYLLRRDIRAQERDNRQLKEIADARKDCYDMAAELAKVIARILGNGPVLKRIEDLQRNVEEREKRFSFPYAEVVVEGEEK